MPSRKVRAALLALALAAGALLGLPAAALAGEAQPIADGEYLVCSYDGASRVLDVCAGSADEGANVTLFNSFNSAWQKWELSYDAAAGAYSLMNANSGLYLGVAEAASYGYGANVAQYAYAGARTLWRAEERADGCYAFVNVASGLLLDVSCGRAVDCANVQLWGPSDTNAGRGQAFRLVSPGGRTVADGTYAIESLSDGLQVLDVVAASPDDGANVTTYTNNNTANQWFRLEYRGSGYYSVTSASSGKALDLVAGGQSSGTNVTQWSYYGGENQLWMVQEAGDGTYYLVCKANGLRLDVSGGVAGDGVNVQTWAASQTNDGKGQRWSFKGVIDDGCYVISCAGSNCVLDVVNASTENGANVTLWDKTGAPNQTFFVKHVSGYFYKIISLNSGKALDVVAGGQEPGTNVSQWSDYDTDNQLWEIVPYGDGTYGFRSKCNGLMLDVDGQQAVAPANVQVWTPNGADTQKFTLTKNLSRNSDLDKAIYTIISSGHNTLNSAFWYVAEHYEYAKGSLWPEGEWSVPFALEMYNYGYGNCYRFAALFCWLARGLGYDANVVAGTVPSVSGGQAPHGWCEIRIDGATYICDPDMANSYGRNSYNFFMITYESAPFDYNK